MHACEEMVGRCPLLKVIVFRLLDYALLAVNHKFVYLDVVSKLQLSKNIKILLPLYLQG